MPVSRRQALGSIGAGLALSLAGCIGGSDSDGANDADPDDGDDTATAGTGDGSADDTDQESASADDLPFEAALVGRDDEHRLFDESEIEAVGEINTGGSLPTLPVTVTEARREAIAEIAQRVELPEHPDEYEFVTRLDDEEVYAAHVSEDLATTWTSGDWNGQIYMTMPSEAEAERVRESIT